MKQKTINEIISVSSIGIHSGNKVNMKLYPAYQNTGIVFKRTDINKSFKMNPFNVKEAVLCTALFDGEDNVKTIEHLLSALAMLGIDNLIIEIDNNEIPIFDGSAMPFIYLIKNAGLKIQSANKKIIKIKKEIEIIQEDKEIKIKPYNGFKINYEIDFNNPFIKSTNQFLSVDFKDNIINEISKARTFGFLKDIEYLKKNNLAKGGSLQNAIIVDEFKILNPEGLRYEDEFVRHKILDAIGDFYVAGKQILGEITAYKSGHNLNNLLLREILSKQENYEEIEIIQEENEKDLILNYNWNYTR